MLQFVTWVLHDQLVFTVSYLIAKIKAPAATRVRVKRPVL
jgi:hypothetical protein